VRIKVPNNRPRWVPLASGRGFIPLEQVIAQNLDLVYPESPPRAMYLFRLTRGAEGDLEPDPEKDEENEEPGASCGR